MFDSDATIPVPPPVHEAGPLTGNQDGREEFCFGAMLAIASTDEFSQKAQAGWQPPSVEDLRRELPQYTVTQFLARGGMGAVYKGVQKALDRVVAIKILPPDVEDFDGSYSERFKQEARAMAKFRHPGIVAVYDAGETPNGLLYFVMEFIEGTDVAQLVAKEGMVAPARALAITAQVCDALTYAHAHGVVHRDIKPSNVMIESDGTVKIADFGLAKITAQDGGITRTNMALGTPDFVAPESLIPGVPVDQRADLYAVGVMLYQMLTGDIPRGRFAMPSGVLPQLDPRFDAVIDKAMQTDRERRYSSAQEVRRDLDQIRALSAERPALPARGRARSILPYAFSVVALAVIGTGGYFMYGKKAATVAGPQAAAPAPNVPLQPLPASPVSFPQGKWVRIYTKFEDLPWELRQPHIGVRWEDGWIKLQMTHNIRLPLANLKNAGVRATFARGEKPSVLIVRETGEVGYRLGLVYHQQPCVAQFGAQKHVKDEYPYLFVRNGNTEVPAGQPYTLEFAVVGSIVVGHFQNATQAVMDATFPEGNARIYGSESVRDIEIINLDGLPENEALRILGVDKSAPEAEQGGAPLFDALKLTTPPAATH